MQTVLIINGHQRWGEKSKGQLNNTLVLEMEKFFNKQHFAVLTTNIEKGYDIDEEIKKHDQADIVILQAPVYWFSIPWIAKKYLDEVFSQALENELLVLNDGRISDNPKNQYGSGGLKQGSKFLLSVTYNAPKKAFNDSEQQMFGNTSVTQQMVAVNNIYRFSGFEIIDTYACFDVMKNPVIAQDLERLNEYLTTII